MVADHGQNEVVVRPHWPAWRVDHDVVDSDLLHGAVEVRLDLSILDTVFNVGLDPVLHVVVKLRVAMHQRNAGAVTPKIQCGDRGGVLAANDHHIRVVIRMRIVIIVRDLG